MSIKIHSLNCTKCKFKSPVLLGLQTYYYQLANNERIKAPTMGGWCLDCNDYRTVQLGLNSMVLLQEHKKRMIDSFEEKTIKSKFKNVKKFISNKNRNKEERGNLNQYDKNVYKYFRVLNYKESLSCCLLCYGTNVFPMNINLNAVPYVTPYSHIGCGGALEVTEGGFRVKIEQKEIFIKPVYNL